MSFLAEIKRRNVHRVMAAYAAGAWLLVEIMDLLTGVYEAPAWVMKVFVAVILVGAVPAAIVSWFYELTPNGLRRETEDGPARQDPIRVSAGRKLNLAILAMLAAAFVMVLLFSGRFTFEEPAAPEQAAAPQTAQSGGPPMVAVLPFDWASLEGDSEFFARGIHDDLLTQLARLKSLRVISRTSVMEFQGVERNLREIGRVLGADAILEGGVQRAGDRIRINAQLIDARTDEHLWANTFDRELSVGNIFDVQAEIARAIAQAMQASLSQADESSIAALPTENMAAYRAFHQAQESRKHAGGLTSEEYKAALRKAVELDPGFTQAWSALVGAITLSNFARQLPEEIAEAEQAIDHIAQIARGSVDHLVAQGYYAYYILREYEAALGLLRQAMVLAPSNVELYSIASWIQRRQNNWDGQIESLRIAWKLDPRGSEWPAQISRSLAGQHHYDEAHAVVEQYLGSLPENSDPSLEILRQQQLYQVRLDRDLGLYLQRVRALNQKFADGRAAERLWEALVATRQYDEADVVLEQFSEASRRKGVLGVSSFDYSNVLTAWLRGEREELSAFVKPLEKHFEDEIAEQDKSGFTNLYLHLALIKAALGESQEAAALVARWERTSRIDVMDRWLNLGYACMIQGMAGLAPETARCLRAAAVEPNYFFRFYEPWLPFYDPVRASPEFLAVFSELEAEYGPMKNWP